MLDDNYGDNNYHHGGGDDENDDDNDVHKTGRWSDKLGRRLP